MFGQGMANRGNMRLQRQQQQWNVQQWMRQVDLDQQLWNQQNEYNQQLWQQQNQYNEAQRADERAYDRMMWDLQNKYNSPVEQMARLREAGLNPHLMYGRGTLGTADSLSTGNIRAGMAESNGLKSPDVQGYSRANVDSVTRGINVFGDYQRFENLQAQTNNVEQQTDLLREDKLLKQQQQALNVVSLADKNLKFGIDKELRQTSVDAAREALESLKEQVKQNRVKTQHDLRTLEPKVQEAVRRAIGIMLDNKGKELRFKMDQLEHDMNKQGIYSKDHFLLRMLFRSKDSLKQGPPPLWRRRDAFNR